MASWNDDSGRDGTVTDSKDETKWPGLKPSQNDSSRGLQLHGVDFHKKDNERKHHTDKFDLDNLVVRRGQDWKFTLTFDRDVNKKDDVVELLFAFGKRPKPSNGSLVRIKLNIDSTTQDGIKAPTGGWSAQVSNVKDKDVEVIVQTPADAFVGKHVVFVETTLKGDDYSLRRYELKDKDVILLFNAWIKDDVVYVGTEEEREEYVLNEYGEIWMSTVNSVPTAWSFDQFDKEAMEVLLYLMDRASQGDAAKRSPVTFTRALASLTNERDNNGVVEGKWSGTFPANTTTPWAWAGSGRILKEFANTRTPVKYGQCWVFSGVLTTLLRAVGIPTRVISNFESGHDIDQSMTIDFHFGTDGKPLTDRDDSVWNVHVWCESFFRRTDLPSGYDGWQVVDSTPQEPSDGIMRLGPTPVKAVKEGHVWVNFDAPFVFAEVNGDKVFWKMVGDKKNARMVVTGMDRYGIGANISTKAVGSSIRKDVTRNYKYPDGSDEELRVTKAINKYSSRANLDIYLNKTVEDVKFTVLPPRNIEIGWGFEVSLKAVNTSHESRHISGRITILSAYHTGVPGTMIGDKTYNVELAPLAETHFSIRLTSDKYVMKINPEATMQIYANFNVTETLQEFGSVKGFSLLKPLVFLRIPDIIRVQHVSKCVASFTNPLPVALTNGFLSLDGEFILPPDVHLFTKPIQPGETVTYEFEVRPKREGVRRITGSFTSDQLSGATGSIEFTALPPFDPTNSMPL